MLPGHQPGPTVVARALFVVSAAGYDAWSAYDAKAVPTIRTGFTRRPSSQRTLANKTAAVSYASHRALAYLTQNNPFQPCRPALDERLTALGLSVAEATSASPATTPGKDGKRAADNLIAARRTDGSNQAGNYADTTGYRPVNTPDTLVDPWRWQPVRVPLGNPNGTPQTPLTPQWGKVRSFDPKLLETSAQAPNPFDLNAQERSAMIDELVRMSAELDDRTKVVAEYWADGPQSELPPGHWNLFSQWVSRRWRQSIDADAKMFLGLNGGHARRQHLRLEPQVPLRLRPAGVGHPGPAGRPDDPGLGRARPGHPAHPRSRTGSPTSRSPSRPRRSRPTPPGTAPSAGPPRPT